VFRPLRAMLRDPETKVLVIAALIVIAVGAAGYMLIEGWTAVQAIYFCVVTLATVGFGDLHPTTEIGQLFTIGYIIVGVGIIAGFISELAKHRTVAPGTIARRIADDIDRPAEDEPRSS
jgi:voltage-gated potassium channel